MSEIRVAPLDPAAIVRHLDALAALRIQVFAAYPYLYDGDVAYEARYLQTYVDSDAAIVVGAFDGERLVGAATGTPLEDHMDGFGDALRDQPLRAEDVFYCAESVLLPEYRGHGIGHRFFDLREAHARTLGRRHSLFCSVIRPVDHPDRPGDYRPLDGFWSKRGYRPLPGAVARFHWKDHREDEETEKGLQVWVRDL